MQQVKVGIVGLGWAASGHVAAFKQNPNVRVSAVCTSKDPAEVRQAWDAEAAVYNKYEDFLAHPDLDVVDICTPHHMHAEQAIQAARAGKHLMIEKPVAIDLESLLAMKDAIDKAKVRSTVFFELRFIPHFALVKSLIARDLLGKVHHLEVDYYHGIGPWYGQYEWNAKKAIGRSALVTAGVHALDALLYFAEREVEEVYAYSARTVSPELSLYEYDTTSVAILKFADGTCGKCVSSVDCRQPYLFNVHLIGSEGTLWNDKFWSTRIEGVRPDEWVTLPTAQAESGDVMDHPYPPQMDHFVECLQAGKDSRINFAEAFRTHIVMFAIEKSLDEGRPVKVAELV
jgi:predicted dehydrogenase